MIISKDKSLYDMFIYLDNKLKENLINICGFGTYFNKETSALLYKSSINCSGVLIYNKSSSILWNLFNVIFIIYYLNLNLK